MFKWKNYVQIKLSFDILWICVSSSYHSLTQSFYTVLEHSVAKSWGFAWVNGDLLPWWLRVICSGKQQRVCLWSGDPFRISLNIQNKFKKLQMSEWLWTKNGKNGPICWVGEVCWWIWLTARKCGWINDESSR